jgi:hypothetical protein
MGPAATLRRPDLARGDDFLPGDVAPPPPSKSISLEPAVPPGEARGARSQRQLLLRALRSRTASLAALTAVALVARLVLMDRSYDIFIDEVSYTNVSRAVAAGHGLTLYGHPFNIHPPLAFLVYAAAIRLFGLHGTTEQVLFGLRDVAAVFGSIVPGVVFLTVERFKSRVAAFGAGMLVALDPFTITFDTRVMLEPIAQLATAATFFCLAAACTSVARSARQRAWLVGAGTSAAASVVTKETFGGVLLVALFVLLVTGWALTRRQVLVVLGVMLAGAGLGVAGSASSNGLASWYATKVNDFYRLVGASQETGFNAPGMHVTILQRALADLHEFWPAYIVLGAGSGAAALIIWGLRPWSAGKRGHAPLSGKERASVTLAVWALCSAAYLCYAMPFGSLEEQMYYILLAPAAASLVAWLSGVRAPRGGSHFAPAVALFWESHRRDPRSAVVPLRRLLAGLVICTLLCGDIAVWAQVHARPDDEYRTFLAWDRKHVPNGAVISVTEDIGQFLVQGAVLGDWETVAQLRRHRVDYLLLSTSLVKQGYTSAPPQFFDYVEEHGRLVFQVKGQSDGALELWDVQALTGAALPADNTARR